MLCVWFPLRFAYSGAGARKKERKKETKVAVHYFAFSTVTDRGYGTYLWCGIPTSPTHSYLLCDFHPRRLLVLKRLDRRPRNVVKETALENHLRRVVRQQRRDTTWACQHLVRLDSTPNPFNRNSPPAVSAELARQRPPRRRVFVRVAAQHAPLVRDVDGGFVE
jgi:hypothetical protein